VRSEPVFYVRSDPRLRFPADLYRANYLGAAMFMDEPAVLLTHGHDDAKSVINHFSDVATALENRTHSTFESDRPYYGRYWLEKQMADMGINFGDMRLAQTELPVWETYFDRAFYEMKGGGSGIAHEGRYQLGEFDKDVARFTGTNRQHTANELLRYHYAYLRGGSRPFGKFWGSAIYGQCDPAIATEAMTTAYDMGARYVWFWTSDHGHHVPWPEQLELARKLKAHSATHPRPSIYKAPTKLDTAIVIPNGYFLSFEDLSWMRPYRENKNGERLKYERLMHRALNAVHQCFDRAEDFDITIDDGRPIKGYKRVIRISETE
jgi:hypothetical protein